MDCERSVAPGGRTLSPEALNTVERIILVFGAQAQSPGWVDAKDVIALVGGGGARTAVDSALETLAAAGYIVRARDRWLYRREPRGETAAAEILDADAAPIIIDAATTAPAAAWAPDPGGPENVYDVIGQARALYQLRLNVDWARRQQCPAKPMLFSGPAGLGKTMIAGLVSRELGGSWIRLSMGDADAETVRSAIDAAAAGGVVLFDELHTATRQARNTLLVTLDQSPLQFTPIGATTNVGILKPDLIRRFSRVIELEPYTLPEAEQIARAKAEASGLEIEDSVATVIARASRCNPARIGVMIDEYVMLSSRLDAQPSRDDFLQHLRLRGTDERGIDQLDLRILYALSEQLDGTAGVHKIAAATDTAVEPALARLHGLAGEGLVRAAGRAGWILTTAGAAYLDRRPR